MKIVLHLIVMACWLFSYNGFATTKEETLFQQITQLNTQAARYYQQGKYPQALEALEQVLLIVEKDLGKQSPSTAIVYSTMGMTYHAMLNDSKALEYEQKALLIKEKSLGKQHADTAESYNKIGLIYDAMANYPKALEYHQQALAVREKVFGKQHPKAADSYNNMGSTYDTMGDYPNALAYYQKSMIIRENTLDKQHADTAQSYGNIGATYKNMGDYPKALDYQQKGLAITEKRLGKQHPSTATSYNNIGIIYDVMGDYPKAMEYKQKAVAIWENTLGKQHPETATGYNNIGVTYDAMGDYPQALLYYQKALVISEKILGMQHPDVAIKYNNIGLTYKSMNNYPKALEYYQKSIAIIAKVLGTQHPSMATGYHNIGSSYQQMGDYSKALAYFKKSMAIREKIGGKQHPHTGASYNNIGAIYDAMGDYVNAYHYAQKAFTAFIQQRDNHFFILDSMQKKQYLTANEHWVDFLLLHAHHYQQSLVNNKQHQQTTALTQATINHWLSYKGSILDSENRFVLLAKTSKDPAIQQKYQQLITLKQAYSDLNQHLPKSEEKNNWQQQLKQQKEKIALIERDITQSDPRFKTEKALQTINSQSIADGLHETELYIDYGKTNDGYYLFTIDHKNTVSFTALRKEDSKEIDRVLAIFNDEISAIIDQYKHPDALKERSKRFLGKLHQLLIPPTLAAKIASKDSLIVSPDGGLRLLPFEALYNTAKKHYLIEKKDIRYIASGKEWVRLFRQQQTNKNSKASKENKAVLFANPDFDNSGVKKSQQPTAIYTRNTVRGKLRSGTFISLKGTQTEAEGIIDILQKNNVRHYYTQSDATEANLVTIKQPTLLHIATHGFFNADTPNPMLQSGLVFAGANIGVKKGTGEGIVTALDLSGLDLKGTDLVVLSACETGKVDPNNTNGVSGLTKAFIQAGSKNVVMSLWQVADKETADLMQSFYRASQKNDRQYANALKQSKLAMIKKGLHPYYWAAFVLSGL